MKSQVEALLFIAAKPLSSFDISKILKQEKVEVETWLNLLIQDYNDANRGMKIITVMQKTRTLYQLVTNPDYADLIKDFTKSELNGELTKPSLETLTIIAYRGPITKPELEKIRGVNCSLILRNLMIRNLVQEEVDKQTACTYYSATTQFLQWLGLTDVSKLPEYDKLNQDEHLKDLLSQDSTVEDDSLDPVLVNLQNDESQ